MTPVLRFPLACAFALALTGCGNGGGGSSGPQASTGPFDSRGNYVEEWADNPSKWKKSGRGPSPHELKSDDLPQIAANDQPPQNAVPLVSSSVSRPEPAATRVTASRPAVVKSSEVVVKSVRPAERSEPAVVKAKPKPKTTVAKAKAKPKPKTTRYLVKKGDSLSTIASRNGTTVSALKSANSISGTLIRPGQALTIPKR